MGELEGDKGFGWGGGGETMLCAEQRRDAVEG
jgi:hypothetical protein